MRTVVVHTHPPTSALLALHTASISQYWHKLSDPTFRGIYHVNAFDLAMMIPYFLVLFVLATYGLHRLLARLRLLQVPSQYSRPHAASHPAGRA